jgi:hypothetical protein
MIPVLFFYWFPTMNLDTSSLTFAIPARVLRTTAERQADLIALAEQNHAIDAGILAERAPFFWSAEISSDVVDAYYTHMLLNTLTNFQNDAKAGVSFLPGHKHDELPFGRSLDAWLENAIEPARTRVVADFYTIPGLNLNGVQTDHLIDGIRSGILKDVSVGFHGGRFLCDVCQRDFWDMECPHVPGVRYEVKDADGVVRVKLATFGVDDAHLSEVSSVFDGATPRAEVIKAEREAVEGRLRPEAARMIEERYRVKLPAAKRSFAGASASGKGKSMELEQQFNRIREILGVDEAADVPATIATLTGEAEALRTLPSQLEAAQKRVAELEALQPLAEDGRTYRSDLIAEALAEGVRAYGDKFDEPTYRSMLEGAKLDVIKRMKTDWATIGDNRFAPGGRKSTEKGEDAPGDKAQRRQVNVPASAFAV